MNFRRYRAFHDSLTKLTTDEQTAVKVTVFDLQRDPSHPSLSFHQLNKAKDKNFWSVRVNDDIRIIVHRQGQDFLLCYVDHHDKAYQWAENRKYLVHPTTGAAQIIEVQEVVEKVVRREYVTEQASDLPAAPPGLFAHLSDETLLGYGVPPEHLAVVRNVTKARVLDLVDHLPEEAAEVLLALSEGKAPPLPDVVEPGTDPFDHPDAQRRFHTTTNEEELRQALEFPWERWIVFLHPSQRDLVTRTFGGPARVSGSAGTGKTVVAIHRAAHLAEQDPEARVLLSTFSAPLAEQLRTKLRRLLYAKPRLGERIDVEPMDALALRLYRVEFAEAPRLASPAEVRALLLEAAIAAGGPSFSETFLISEWEQVVDARQLRDWASYRTVPRLGRKVALPEAARARLWTIFEAVHRSLDDQGRVTQAAVYQRLAEALGRRPRPVYEHVVLDEAQDASAAQLRFLANLVGDRPNGLFFAGDLGQRIFQQPFSWLSVGVDIRGRSRNLKVNYRTSHQIRQRADHLLDVQTDDVDGEHQDRRGTVSVFSGPEPELVLFPSANEESVAVAAWLRQQVANGMRPEELGVFVRSEGELGQAIDAVRAADLLPGELGASYAAAAGHVTVATMHLAKGLEFRAVAVMACNQNVLPLASREAQAADMQELEEINETERHLLYVALTRARDELWVSGVAPGSVFLHDLGL